jgi:hypothetical protein
MYLFEKGYEYTFCILINCKAAGTRRMGVILTLSKAMSLESKLVRGAA